MKRLRIDILGQSGSGLLTVGTLISYALKNSGLFVNSDREYPSLIKGGHSLYTINVSDKPLWSLEQQSDIAVALDKQSLVAYFDRLVEGGILIHAYERTAGIRDILDKAKERNITVISLPGRKVAHENGGNELMVNMVITGMTWKCLGEKYDIIEGYVQKKFAKKPKILEIALKCLQAGYDQSEVKHDLPDMGGHEERQVLLDGNYALALGAIHAGVRVYVAYPMSPASSVLSYLAKLSVDNGMVIKQAEDEITAAQMAVGAMFAGTRALTATSGGGYDLMTETVSHAGITETPLVIIVAQRPGPATGLPTWTCQSDLNLSIHSAHGEFPKVVIGVSDPTDCFDLMQQAMNIAEEYQVFVMVLTEKVIAETHYTIPAFDQGKIPIKRGLVADEELTGLEPADRYKITEDGVSKRWIPGSCDVHYYANSDEHDEMGRLTEEAEPAREMYAKRMRKLDTIKKILPDPEIIGVEKGADISFIGWGSSRNVMRDVIEDLAEEGITVNYLHYSYVHPLKGEKAKQFFKDNKNVHLIEGNYNAQLGTMVEAETGKKFVNKFLKWDGRPFFADEVRAYVLERM